LNPVPIGMPGEIYIGGCGLARGYVNNPQLTAERIIPNPFAGNPCERIYRTGDLARYREDGNIEFLGRVDHQVKVRGFRVELGEIEAVLRGYPGVRDCVVTLRELQPGDERLIAYVIPKENSELAPSKLREFLRNAVPDYMLPSAFVPLEALPLSPNGKVDRRVLPAPNVARPQSDIGYVAPRTLTEQRVARIWSELLGVEKVGVHDSFFELGGESLLAVRLTNRLEREFAKDVRVTTLFRHATVEELAGVIDGTRTDSETEIVEIQPHGSQLPLFVIHGIGGDLMYARPFVAHLGPDQPVFGVQSMDDGLVRFEDLASRLVAAIRQKQPQGPYRLAGHCYGGMLAYEIARQLRELGCEVGLLALLDTSLVPAKRSIANRAYIVMRFVKNLPFRIATVFYFDRPDRLPWRVKQRILLLLRDLLARLRNDPAKRSLGDVVDIDRIRPGDEARWQRDLRAQQNYRPLPYDGRLLLVRAHTRPLFRSLDHDLGWSRLVKNALDVKVVPGSHANMLDEPQVRYIAEVLYAELTSPHRLKSLD
jgi:thioesterase domain-containing protein